MKSKLIIAMLLAMTACNGADSANSAADASSGAIGSLPNNGGTSSSVGSGSSNTPSPTPSPSATPVSGGSSSSGGIALVYSGNGACTENCASSAGAVAKLAGLTVKYVTGKEITSSSTAAQIAAVFAGAKVWVMPGGVSNTEITTMGSAYVSALRNFVSNGGGYVGFCAGAFAATTKIGDTSQAGLGIFPGNTPWYDPGNSVQDSYGGSIQHVTWFNETRYMYLEGGPHMTNLTSAVEVVSRYDDNVSVAAARTTYGSGRVFISGTHPEAPTSWWSGTNIKDNDGNDQSLAADMVKWAARL